MTKKNETHEEQYVRVCPNCKSLDVEMDRSNPVQPVLGLPAMYICRKCGHSGHVFPEVEVSEIEGFEKKVKKKHLSDTKKDTTPLADNDYGDFIVRAAWKITGPVLLVFGFLSLRRDLTSAVIFLSVGSFMSYITFFKKRRLKD